MARTIHLALAGFFLVGLLVISRVEVDAEPLTGPSALVITLGQAAAPLYGPWKFTVGDAPMDAATRRPLWAEPSFDDSSWETVDLAPQGGAPASASEYVPGWTARGHADYWGWAWYRLRVKVAGKPGEPLALDGPASTRMEGDARATCLAMRIAGDGSVALANAGHMPPYLNGQALEIEGSLPPGMLDRPDCSRMVFRLAESDRLLLSDGVAEATDQNGNLFGFDRLLDLIRTRPSAAEIAEAAQAFGQSDDISVIAVTRMTVAEPARA